MNHILFNPHIWFFEFIDTHDSWIRILCIEEHEWPTIFIWGRKVCITILIIASASRNPPHHCQNMHEHHDLWNFVSQSVGYFVSILRWLHWPGDNRVFLFLRIYIHTIYHLQTEFWLILIITRASAWSSSSPMNILWRVLWTGWCSSLPPSSWCRCLASFAFHLYFLSSQMSL